MRKYDLLSEMARVTVNRITYLCDLILIEGLNLESIVELTHIRR